MTVLLNHPMEKRHAGLGSQQDLDFRSQPCAWGVRETSIIKTTWDPDDTDQTTQSKWKFIQLSDFSFDLKFDMFWT